ncbi:MAG: energy transducer TonB, partial [Pseudomonadota bacterium]|nr:energy transducer TonB [Pseudomonadota bacterium]
MIGSLLCCLAFAQEPAEAPGQPAPPLPLAPASAEPAPSAPPDAFVPPAPLLPLVVAWPADEPAPREATAAIVEVELLVDERGSVESVVLVSGEEPFASVTVAAMRLMRFTAATEGGVPVAVQVPVRLEIAPPPINVEGIVRFAPGSGEPGGSEAPAVGLLVSVAGQSVRTDEEGRFGFRGVPDGAQLLTVVTTGTVK